MIPGFSGLTDSESTSNDTTSFEEVGDRLVIRTVARIAHPLPIVLAMIAMVSAYFPFAILLVFWIGPSPWISGLFLVVPMAVLLYFIYAIFARELTITVDRDDLTIKQQAPGVPLRSFRCAVEDIRQAYVSRHRFVRGFRPTVVDAVMIYQYGWFIDSYYVHLARDGGLRFSLCRFRSQATAERVARRINRFLRRRPSPVVSAWYQRFPLLEKTTDDDTERAELPQAIAAHSFPLPFWMMQSMMTVGFAVLAIMVGVFGYSLFSALPARPPTPPPPLVEGGMRHSLLGQTAPSLQAFVPGDERGFAWQSHAGRDTMLVTFVSGTDPGQQAQMAILQSIATRFRGRQAVVCVVRVGDASPGDRRLFRTNYPLVHILLDPKLKACDAYQVRVFPSTFVIDANGRLAAYRWGEFADQGAWLGEQLQASISRR